MAYTVIACNVVEVMDALVKDKIIDDHYGIWKAEQIATDPCVSSQALILMLTSDDGDSNHSLE